MTKNNFLKPVPKKKLNNVEKNVKDETLIMIRRKKYIRELISNTRNHMKKTKQNKFWRASGKHITPDRKECDLPLLVHSPDQPLAHKCEFPLTRKNRLHRQVLKAG